MPPANIAQVTTQAYDLLSPLTSEERGRVIAAVVALCGDTPPVAARTLSTPPTDMDDSQLPAVGPRATRWIRQEGLTAKMLNEVFLIGEAGSVELIATDIPGSSKKEQTGNVYLLSGARSFLATDEPTVENSTAVEHCKRVGCYDKNNHTANRNALGNRITGSVTNGFTLPAPGLREAATIIKAMTRTRT